MMLAQPVAQRRHLAPGGRLQCWHHPPSTTPPFYTLVGGVRAWKGSGGYFKVRAQFDSGASAYSMACSSVIVRPSAQALLNAGSASWLFVTVM